MDRLEYDDIRNRSIRACDEYMRDTEGEEAGWDGYLKKKFVSGRGPQTTVVKSWDKFLDAVAPKLKNAIETISETHKRSDATPRKGKRKRSTSQQVSKKRKGNDEEPISLDDDEGDEEKSTQ